MAHHRRTGSIPALQQYQIDPGSNESGHGQPHHHHQVLYVCRGHCSGPQCDFSKSLRQWHSTIWLNDGSLAKQVEHQQVVNAGQAEPPTISFQSQVVASAPKALEKLDQKRQTLHKLRNVLAQKLENKHKQKESKKLQRAASAREQKRSASAMMVGRPKQPELEHTLQLQERSASAMTVLKPLTNNLGNCNFAA